MGLIKCFVALTFSVGVQPQGADLCVETATARTGDTDRGPFAAVEAPVTVKELREMAGFFRDYTNFENNKLSEGSMYSGSAMAR